MKAVFENRLDKLLEILEKFMFFCCFGYYFFPMINFSLFSKSLSRRFSKTALISFGALPPPSPHPRPHKQAHAPPPDRKGRSECNVWGGGSVFYRSGDVGYMRERYLLQVGGVLFRSVRYTSRPVKWGPLLVKWGPL